MICRASAPDDPNSILSTGGKTLLHCRKTVNIVQSHSMYYNNYIMSSYAARIVCQASAPDAPTQFFQLVVKHYYIAGRPLTGDQLETKQYISISCNPIAT